MSAARKDAGSKAGAQKWLVIRIAVSPCLRRYWDDMTVTWRFRNKEAGKPLHRDMTLKSCAKT
jgi:hypothetical protein